jgi:tetratricopeptide (TPR) repeat protein
MPHGKNSSVGERQGIGMEISLATIYGILFALGLVSVDTVLNANTLYLESSVAKKYEEVGYSSEVVQRHIINELATIAETPSLVSTPVIKSSDTPSVSAAVASLVNLQASLEAAQDLVGYAPPRLYAAAVIHDEQDVFELTGRSRLFGRFSIAVEGDGKGIDEMIEEVAYRTFRELDPYGAVLHRFADAEDDLTIVESELDDLMDRLRNTAHFRTRAQMHNLKGIVLLDKDDIDGAVEHFDTALDLDPRFHVASLNLALAHVQLDQYQQAIDSLNTVAEPWMWPATSNSVLLATAYTLRGVAYWGQQDMQAAKADLEYAVYLQPTSTAAHYYLAGLYHELGDPDGRELAAANATNALVHFETYPEVALLYFWVSPYDMRPLERRGNTLPSWHTRDENGPTAPAPAPAPAAPTPTQAPAQETRT